MLRSLASSFTLLAEIDHDWETHSADSCCGWGNWRLAVAASSCGMDCAADYGTVSADRGIHFVDLARFQLGGSFTVKAEARQLVTRGLYSKIRNPIYVFGSMVMAGWILVFGKPVWLLIFLLVIPLQIWRTRKESAVLESAFGEEYRKYRAGTWF